MNKVLITVFSLLISSTMFAQSKKELIAETTKLKTELAAAQAELVELKKAKPVSLTNECEKASYGVGILFASQLVGQGGDSLNAGNISAGIADVFQKQPLKMQDQEASGYIQGYLTHAMAKKSQKVKDEGITFLNENKIKPGVVTTASGLQYKVLVSGKGKSPKATTDKVTVHYTGNTLDGKIFDSSHRSGKPITFALNGVITGWTEVLQLMHEGDKWTVYIPSELGYGERGNGAQIPPYSVLVFELELTKVE